MLEIGLVAHRVVMKGAAIDAAAHDHRELALPTGPEDVRIDERPILERNLDVPEAADAEDVAPNLVAGGRRRAQGAGARVSEQLGGIEIRNQAKHLGVLREVPDMIGLDAGKRHVAPEVDRPQVGDVMDLGGDVDSAVDIAVAVEAAQETGDISESGIEQLLDIAVDAADEVGHRQPRRAIGIADGNLADEECDPLTIRIAELALLVGETGRTWAFVAEAGQRSGKDSSQEHVLFLHIWPRERPSEIQFEERNCEPPALELHVRPAPKPPPESWRIRCARRLRTSLAGGQAARSAHSDCRGNHDCCSATRSPGSAAPAAQKFLRRNWGGAS